MPHQIASHMISPLPEVDHSHNLPSRGRKMSSTGGNRSWSEEEENYLLQTRMQKMPYKHIAAHLKKTELACRLHYHQLSHGSHRRKRTGSVSSSNSHGSVTSSGSSPRSQYDLGYHHEDDGLGYSPVRYGMNTTPAYTSHKVLLPKPMPLTPPEHADPHHGLRINTAMQTGSSVDTDRLRAIYDQHRSTFWNAIAHDYGQDASPSQLEAIWSHKGKPNQANFGPPLMRPPTPGDSPDRLGRPMLHNPYSATDYRTNMTPLNMQSASAVSAISAPDRMGFGFGLPTPASAYPRPTALARANTWDAAGYGTAGQAPTAIASLLTENKCPRGTECTDANCRSRHGHC